MGRLVKATFFPQNSKAIKQKARILVIDDDPGFTRAAKLILEKTGGYFAGEENDPTQAHQTAQNFKPDLILLDIAMPQTNGGEVPARKRSDPAWPRLSLSLKRGYRSALRWHWRTPRLRGGGKGGAEKSFGYEKNMWVTFKIIGLIILAQRARGDPRGGGVGFSIP